MISGVKLCRDTAGRVTLSFCDADRNHPDLLRRSRQVAARGEARGALEWATLTGKDARLWQAFRPLEYSRVRLAQFLQEALAPPASGLDLHPFQALDAAAFRYWWQPDGSDDRSESVVRCPLSVVSETEYLSADDPIPIPVPTDNRPRTTDSSLLALDPECDVFEIDLRIQVGRSALLYIRSFEADEWESFADDIYPDELARALDYGTAEAYARRIADFYLIAVTPCRDPLQPYSARIQEYRDHPDTLRLALAHRADLGLEEFALLAGRIGWTTWADVEAWGR
jgi:hypothetical protein